MKVALIAGAVGVVVAGYFMLNQSPSIETTSIVPTATNSSTTDAVPMEQPVRVDEGQYEGTHIMPDGTVMNADGNVLADAIVLPDGTVRLVSGDIITPAMDMRPSAQTEPTTVNARQVVIDIVGIDFSYDLKEIRVKQGDVVTINFTSKQGFHDWVVDAFNAATERVNEGQTTSVTFVADKKGTFQYYCSVMNHRQMGMVGYLIVE